MKIKDAIFKCWDCQILFTADYKGAATSDDEPENPCCPDCDSNDWVDEVEVRNVR